MASTYSSRLRLELMAFGEKTNSWGAITNTNLGTLIEDAISGRAGVSMPDANYTLTTNNGSSDEARCAIIELSGTLTAARDLIIPNVSKTYWLRNGTNQTVNVKTSSGSAVAVTTGSTIYFYCDGFNNIRQLSALTALTNVTSLLIGSGTQQTYASSFSPRFQTVGLNATDAGYSLARYSADTGGPAILLAKSRGTTVGATNAVASLDVLGNIAFDGSTGSAFVRGAQIFARARGTITASNLPSEVVFRLMDNAGATGDPLVVSYDYITSIVPFAAGLGAVGAPSYTFSSDPNTGIWSPAADTIAFSANGAESARISTSGFLIGTTSSLDFSIPQSVEGLHYNLSTKTLAVARNGGPAIAVQRIASNGDLVVFYRNSSGSQVGSISYNGTNVLYNATSDYRMKEGIEELDNFGEIIDSLRPRRWIWKNTGTPGSGFVAHELHEVIPQVVNGEKDGETMQGVAYGSGELIGTLVAAVKDLRTRVASLEAN